MSLKCPACGEKTLKLVEYTKRAVSSHRDKAIYECSNCGHKEVLF
jgi:predicted RNA-binding Zn-ribbon protein involved in translation (DUF1610 family)